MPDDPREASHSEAKGGRAARLTGGDRELLSANKTLRLFTFSKTAIDSDYDRLAKHEDRLNVSSDKPEELSPQESSTTTDELLKALAKRGMIGNKPPPLPPKPKTSNLDSHNVAEHSSRRFFTRVLEVGTESSSDSPMNESNRLSNRKYDAYKSSMAHLDNNDRDYSKPVHQFSVNASLNSEYSKQESQPKRDILIDSSMYKSTIEQSPPMTDFVDNNNGSNHAIKPIVTESPDDATNNNVSRSKITNTTSTVEILEVPSTTKPLAFNKCSNTTFSRSSKQHHQQLFYENNSYTAPLVTSATDDEDEDQSDNGVPLPNENDVESILNESSNHHKCNLNQEPRTSTPTRLFIGSSPSQLVITHNSILARNQKTHAFDIQKRRPDISANENEDTSNISHETDDLANTSALNQSGGCELIGVNDISDPSSSPKESSQMNNLGSSDRERSAYTVQVFNETGVSSRVSPSDQASKITHEDLGQHSTCQEKIKELENFTSSLQNYVDTLKTQVTNLSAKVGELESQVDKQEQSVKALNEVRDLSTFNLTSEQSVPPLDTYLGDVSKSCSTINKLNYNDMSQSSTNIGCQNPTSTYSRTQVATRTRNTVDPTVSRCRSSSGLQKTSSTPFNNTTNPNHGNRSILSQSCNNTVTNSLMKIPSHASTNSLYGEGSKPESTSVSPTPNYQHYRQSISPTSLSKRDQPSHMSMLSLTSMSQYGTPSTLKKGSAVSGSISNLSQIGSQLTSWPSMSDFVSAKHRAKDIHYSEEERLIRLVLYNSLITMRLPSWVDDDYHLDRVIEAPSARLKLDWVYGYRGRDCRNNLFYLPTGECVYFVASVVVLYNYEEKTQRHYLGHTESVKCLAVHPNKLIIASGQSAIQNIRDKRPIVRVWNTVSLATLRVIAFNEDFDRSICCLAFSKHDQGATLAVVDESNEHTITLLDWQRERNWRIAETNSGHELVLAIEFHPLDKYSLVAVGKSSINFWDTRGMTPTKKAGLFDKYDKPKYVLCFTFNDMGDTVTGDSNGSIIIWPRGSNRPKKVIYDAHQGGVFSVLAMKDGSFLTGGRDRRIIEWDENFQRTGREAELPEHFGGVRYITYGRGSQVLIGTLRNCILVGSLSNNFVLIMQGHNEAISSLAIHPNQSQYLTGGFDDQIHLFDVGTHASVWSKCLMMPATSASFSPNGYLLVVGSTLGKWLVIDAITQEILFTKCDGSGTINCIKFSPDGEYFCLGSSDSQIYVYQTTEVGNKFCKLGTCVGHSGPVKEIDWSNDGRFLQTQSMNFELLFWKAVNCRPLDDDEIIDNLNWYTHNCTLGFNVIGLWSDSIDSALINYCDKSNNNDLLVSATDTGSINILKWPAYTNQSLSQKYYGNAEKFNFIKFLSDDTRLIAVGSKNCVTTEWIVDKGEPLDSAHR